MIKTKETMKRLKSNYKNIICVPYCGLYQLLSLERPFHYTAGIYGWNSDVYYIDFDTIIVTGYRPFGNIKPAYETCQKYEKLAAKIKQSNKTYEIKKETLKALIDAFVIETINK